MLVHPAMGFTNANRWRGGRSPRKWAFTVKDIADATGWGTRAVRRAILDQVVNPADLGSMARFVFQHGVTGQVDLARRLFDAGCEPEAAAKALGVSRSTYYRRAGKKPAGSSPPACAPLPEADPAADKLHAADEQELADDDGKHGNGGGSG